MKYSMPILPLKLEDVSFQAGGKRLIKEFNCEFGPGPRSVIIGPNGAGKSLFLKICHGLIPPHTGTVKWNDPNDTSARRYQAMVFQRPVMLRRSVSANIHYPLKLRKIPKAERIVLVEEALTISGISRFRDHSARVLSFGEQQKLALARAWALKPQVLFLDEPTASLDPAATHTVEEIIHAIHKQGTKIIMTTHDLAQAKRIADEVLFMFRGRLLERAPASTFFKQPKNDLAQAFVKGELLWWRMGKASQKYKYKKMEE
jgi:tungstate transport system ATP-binding protein